MSFKAIETQEELDGIIGERLARQKETLENQYSDYEQLKTKNAELEKTIAVQQASIEEASQKAKGFEQEKSDLNAKISGYETDKLKTKIALEAGIPLELADRLVGNDETALKADAERFSGFKVKAPASPLKDTEPNVGDLKDGAYKSLIENLDIEGE